jgi:hypothetical protein
LNWASAQIARTPDDRISSMRRAIWAALGSWPGAGTMTSTTSIPYAAA